MDRQDDLKIAIIGAGHMGLALAKGFLRSKAFKKSQIILASPRKPEIDLKYIQYNNLAVKESRIIFLAVKPAEVGDILENIEAQSEEKLLVSLAAGVSLQKLKQLVKGKNMKAVRIMPNLAVQTGEGVIGVYKKQNTWIPDRVRDDKVLLLKEKLSLLGEVVEVQNEKDLDILTIISGCSPAIVAYLAQSFANFSNKPEKLILKSLIGSLKYIEESGLTFNEVIKAVATKGGITENILNFLEEQRVNKSIETALESGYTKIRNLKL